MQVKSNEPDIHELDFTVLAAAATAQEGAHIQEAILRSKIDSAQQQVVVVLSPCGTKLTVVPWQERINYSHISVTGTALVLPCSESTQERSRFQTPHLDE